MRAALIIPAYNEEERLPGTLDVYEEAMRRRFGGDFQNVVVANGCADNTIEVATDEAVISPRIRAIDIEEPVVEGGAILEGFRRASGGGVFSPTPVKPRRRSRSWTFWANSTVTTPHRQAVAAKIGGRQVVTSRAKLRRVSGRRWLGLPAQVKEPLPRGRGL